MNATVAVKRRPRPAMELPAPPTGIAILGCGHWGMNYVRVLSELPDSRVVVVCDERSARLDDLRRRFPELEVTTDADKAVNWPGVEAVVVATHATTHSALVESALWAGKHVLAEKPLATTVGEAEELVALAESQQCLLLVDHTFLYNSGIRKVKECLDAERAGEVYYAYARRTNLGPVRHDVNAVWDLAPHDVAIFVYLLGGLPKWVSAVGGRVLGNEREDVGFVSLGYPGGILAHIHVSWAEPHKVREVVVVGSHGRIVFDDLNPIERVRVFEKGVRSVPAEEPTSFGEYTLLMRDGDIVSPAIGIIEPLKHVCGHFLHCVRRGEAPLTDGAHARDVLRVMAAIEDSLQQNGTPVPIERHLAGTGAMNGARR